jgi:hypothetical protein
LNAQLLVSNRQAPIDLKKKLTQESEKKEVYEISFIPTQPGIHKCLLIFNTKQIKGLNYLQASNLIKFLPRNFCKNV